MTDPTKKSHHKRKDPPAGPPEGPPGIPADGMGQASEPKAPPGEFFHQEEKAARRGRPPKPKAPPAPPAMKPDEIASDLVPATAAVSSALVSVNKDPLTPEEDQSWRGAAARVAVKYLGFWILPELILIACTAGPAFRRADSRAAKIGIIVGSLVCIGAAVFAHKRLQDGPPPEPAAAPAP